MGSFLAELGVNVPQRFKRLVGMFIMAVAGFCFVLAGGLTQIVMQIAVRNNSTLTPLQVITVRSVVALVCSVVLMVVRGTHPYGERCSNILPYTLLAIFKEIYLYLQYSALSLIPIGDFKVLEFTFTVFSALFGFICLAQRCSFLDSFLGALSFVGVVFVAQPQWLFTETSDMSYFDASQYFKGVIFSLAAAISMSLHYVLNSYLGKSMPIVLSVFYPNMYGAVIPPLIMLTLGQKFILTELDVVGWTLLLVVGVLCSVGMLCCSESFQLENVGPVSLIRGLDIVYAIIVQLVLVKVKVTWNVLVGALIILSTTSIIILNRWIGIQEWIEQRLCTSKYDRVNSDDEVDGSS